MSKFNTSKNKLQKLWEEVVSNNNQYDKKFNQDKFSFFNNLLKQQNIKTPIEIYDSGNINLTPELYNTSETAIKSEKIPTTVSYSKNIDLEIPEFFLPFIKYSIEVSPTPDTEIHTVYEYDPSSWAGDYIQIKGDGKLLFVYDINDITGTPTTIGTDSGSYTFSEAYFTANSIDLDLTKKVWEATILKTDESTVEGNVTEIGSTLFTSEGTGNCAGEYNKEIFAVDPLNNKNHKIISLSSTSFTAIGDLTVITVTDNGSSCDQSSVTTTDIQKTYSFSLLDSYYIRLHTSGFVVNDEDIQTLAFERNGRWLYWSNLTQQLFVFLIKATQDGDRFEIGLSNLPIEDTGDPESDVLPYTSITLKRNLASATSVPILQKLSESFSQIHEYGEDVKLVENSSRKFKNYVEISNPNASIPTYRFKLNGEFIISSPAINLSDDTIDFPVYNDIYTQVESPSFPGVFSYQLTTENHSLLEKEIWLPDTQDVIVNIKAYLINPLYWREQRRYNKNDL